MFSNLASGFSNFFAINWESLIITGFDPAVQMDSISAVIICNCTLSIVLTAIAIWTMRFRRQLIGLTNFFDRCSIQWQRLAIDSATITTANRIQHLRQIYQQQLGTLDRLQRLRSLFRLARFVMFKRR